jgi:hypothetical protein
MAQTASLYRAFGVDFQSALPLPEMREGWEGARAPVTIRRASAPRPAGVTEIDRGVVADPQVFWMEVPNIVRLLVTAGTEITVEILGNATDGEVRAYLLGSAMGALLHQRGLLPLHASAVEIDGRAIAFIGTSGAGKSTMALHLNARGHPLICDDICAVDTSGAIPVVWPGLINLKLWRDSLASTGRATDGLEQVLPTLDKYRLPIAATAAYERYLLGGIVCLIAGSEKTAAALEPLTGAEAAAILIANSFRGQLIKPMARSLAHFEQVTAIARITGVQRLSRPWAINQLATSCALVERSADLKT